MSSSILSALRPLTAAPLTPGDQEKLHTLLRAPQNDALYFHQILVWGRDLKNKHQDSAAAQVFQALDQEGVPEATRSEARREREAMAGGGSFGMRAEYRIGRLMEDVRDYRLILPMMAGTAASGLVRSAALARHGWVGSKWVAESFAFAAELPIFVGAQRALLNLEGFPRSKDLLSDLTHAGITLGVLRFFGRVGRVGAPRQPWLSNIRMAPAGAIHRASTVLFSQVATFLGLWTAQRIQNDQTTAFDTLSSMIALSVGANLGNKITGGPLLGLGRELSLRRAQQPPFQSPFLGSWGEGRRPVLAIGLPPVRSIRPGSPFPPNTVLIKGQDFSGGKNFEEELPIEELAYHTEMGSKSHAKKLMRRAATDPQAHQALQEAIRRYHQNRLPVRWVQEPTAFPPAAEPARRLLVGRHFYQIIQEESGRRWKLILERVSGNTAKGESLPRTIQISAPREVALSMERLSATLYSLLEDYSGGYSEVSRKGIRVDFSEAPADYLQAKLRPRRNPFPSNPAADKQALRRSFPPGKLGARLFDWVEKAKRDPHYASRLISRAQRNHPFFREAVTRVDLSHYEAMARADMEYLDLITRFALCHHPDAIPVLGRLAIDIPLAVYELQFLAEEGKKAALGALGQVAYYQPLAKKILQELSGQPEYRKPIRRALKSGKYDRLLNL